VLADPKWDEKAYDRERKSKQRAAGREIVIPQPKNIERRLEAESHPIKWLECYFGKTFHEPFTQDREDMVLSIVNAARYGGDQAIAGSRGEGKTTIAIKTALYCMIRSISTFPIVIGKNQNKSNSELKELRRQLPHLETFAGDYPEICIPLALGGKWSSGLNLLTVGGRFINMALGADHIKFPEISASQVNWPVEIEPASKGQVLFALGIDGAIRGTKHGDRRPTLAIIDDIEDREAAASDAVIAKNEDIIEQDIAGLAQSSEQVSRVMLCTTQNRKCIAYRYTDPKQKPSWNGRRYRKMIQPPTRMDLVEQFIDLWRNRTAEDRDAREAYRFWRDNREKIEEGAQISNPYSFSKKLHADGEPLEVSAIHAYYCRVAKNGQKSVSTEVDNDPPEETGPVGMGLTAQLVASRNSGLGRGQLPANATALTVGIDIGKYNCHWTACAWWPGAGGCIIDYGILEVHGNEGVRLSDRAADQAASEPAIYRALLAWRDEILNKEYVDATGTKRTVDFVLVDSGAYKNAIYEFCRQVRGPFHPSKGLVPYHARKQSSDTVLASSNLHAVYFDSEKTWLYELDSDYWKKWVHERFLSPTFDENNMLRSGALSLFHSDRTAGHNSFSQHIVAEEFQTQFVQGKGVKSKWEKVNENNHWLDATYLAAAASEVLGVKLVGPSSVEIGARSVDRNDQKQKAASRPRKQHGGANFRQRPGGWIPKRRD
jgi:hypothetical protein